MNLKEIMKSEPFSDKLIIDRIENALNFKGEKIMIFAFESDYLFYGVKIKQQLEKDNLVTGVSLDDSVFLGQVFEDLVYDIDRIICVGKLEIINLLRCFLPNKDILYIPTDLVFYGSFSKECYIIKNGIVLTKKAKLPTVIVDIGIFPKLKLRNIADSFCSVAVSAFWKIDYTLLSIINNSKLNEKALQAVDEAHKVLNKINSKNCYEVLLTCQIWLSFAVETESKLDQLADLSVGIIFNRLSQSTMEECRFFAVEYLLKLYRAVLNVDVGNNLIYPDYLTNVLRLTELFSVNSTEYLENHKVYAEKFCQTMLNKIRNSKVDTLVEKLLKTLPSYKNAYKNLYKAKKARAKFEIEDSLKAISLAGVTAQGYLKLLYDSGVLQLIEKI